LERKLIFRGATDERDRLILSGVRDGQTNAEIAKRIGLAPNSVRTYITLLYARYHVHGRASLVVAAIDDGTIEPYNPQKKTRSA